MTAAFVSGLVGVSSASGEVAPIEVEAYREAFDVSAAKAEEHLEIQAKGTKADIVEELEQRLDEDYAGVWFDNASGEFVVPVLPDASRAAVNSELASASLAGDYRAPLVEHSWEELEVAQHRIDAGWAELVESGALKTEMMRTGLDARANSVIVRISAAASKAERAGVERLIRQVGAEADLQGIGPERLRVGPAACTVEHAICDLPLRGGAYIGSDVQTPEVEGAYCSVAFPARGNTNGKRYILTAGHCIKEPDSPGTLWSWHTFDHRYSAEGMHAIGDAEQWHYPGADWAKINVTGSWADVAPWPSQVAFWGHGPEEPWIGEYPWGQDLNYPIYGESSSLEGQTVCHSGVTTGGTCGTVVDMNQTWEYGPDEKIHGLTAVRGKYLCVGDGDSGGSVFSNNMAVGILSGGGVWAECYDPEKALPELGYTEITEATDELNVSIDYAAPSQTTASVTQKLCPVGAVTVSGNVTSDGNPVRYGTVTVTLWKWENNQWVVKQGHQSGVSNGAYQVQATVGGAGKWRAKATLEASDGLDWSESGYQEFTVQASSIVAEEYSAGPRTVVDCDGAMHVFYRDTSGKLGQKWLPKGSESWSGELRSGSMAGDPRPLIDTSGYFHVFYRKTDGNMIHQWIPPGGNWGEEVRPVNSMAGDPRAILDPDGAIHLFYRETSGNLGHQWLPKGSESWSGEVRPVNAMAGDPRVLIDTSGVLHVFYRETSGNIGHQWIPPGGNWSGEVRPVSSMAGDPTVYLDPDGALHLFYRQTDGKLGHQWLVKGSESWSGEVRNVNSMAGDPRVLTDTSGVLHVFYTQTDGNIGHQWIPKGGNWSGEVRPVNSMGGSPAVIVDPDGAIHLLYRQTDGKLGHQWLVKGSESWSGEVRNVNSMAGDPRVFTDTSGVFHVFYRETSGNIGHQWIPKGGSWGGEVQTASTAARPPAASTGAATGIGTTSATVHATVAPENAQTNYHFEYGKTPFYGSKQPLTAKSVGDASGSFALSEQLSGLTAGTTYYYRVVATSGEGTTKGAGGTFTTLSAPIVVTKPATGVTATQATLPASVNPGGFGTTYRFDYGKTTSYGQTTTSLTVGSGTEAVAVSRLVSGLAPNTTYHYRVVATNSQGTTYGSDLTFKTKVPAMLLESTFGSQGTGNGQFSTVSGIAVDSGGNIWAVDGGTGNRVEKFNSKGEYLTKFGSQGSGNGQFEYPVDIAIDSGGNLWVADSGGNRVEKFNSKGEYLTKFGSQGGGNGQFEGISGIAISPDSHIWATDWGYGRIEEFLASGSFVRSLYAGAPAGIAADSGGNIWVANGEGDVQKRSSTGQLLATYGSLGSGNGQFIGPYAIEVAPSGNILVGDNGNGRVQELTPSGEYVAQFGGGQFQGIGGIAAIAGGVVYVSNQGAHRVEKWVPAAVPTATTQAATKVTAKEATLNATVNPKGLSTSYRFEYGTTAAYGTSVPVPDGSAGSGFANVERTSSIGGLTAGTTYHFRVVSSNSEGTTYGSNLTFTTPSS